MAQSQNDKDYQLAAYGNVNRANVINRDGTKGWKFDHGGSVKKSGFGFPFPMGGGRGGGNIEGFAREDYERQLALMDKAAEMGAGYSSNNTLGTTDIDYENKMITEKLSPELQKQYDTLLKQSGGAADRIAAMDGDPYAMQMYLYNQNADLRAGEADDLRNATMESLNAKGMLGSTGGAGLYGSVEDSIAAADTEAFNNAFSQSQALYDMERARQTGDLSTATALGLKQIPYITAGTQQGAAIPIKNVEGVSGASRNIFGVQSAASMGNAKRKQGIWDSLLGGGSGGGMLGGGGGLGSYIATATTDALGEEGLKTFEDWRDYMFTVLPTFTASFGRYRATAPKIVEQIDKKENSKALYKEIWDDYLKPIFYMIKEDRDNPKALSDYKIMVRELTKKYLRS
jgi:hypothetical protein